MGYGLEFYQSQTILMTGITALLTMVPCIWFYQKDKGARIARGVIPEQPGKKLKPGEGILLLLLGASLATFANMLVALLQNVLNVQEYQENMAQITNGKSLFMLIFWMGVIALADLPEAERLYQGGNGGSDIRSIFWCLSHESYPGCLCRNPGICICVFPGDHRKPVGKCSASYGCKYLVPASSGNAASDAGETDGHRCNGDIYSSFMCTWDRQQLL